MKKAYFYIPTSILKSLSEENGDTVETYCNRLRDVFDYNDIPTIFYFDYQGLNVQTFGKYSECLWIATNWGLTETDQNGLPKNV